MSHYSIKRNGRNADYKAQDVPYAKFPSPAGVVLRAGTEVGGRICPRCPYYIAVTSLVVRLPVPCDGRWWVHAHCATDREKGIYSEPTGPLPSFSEGLAAGRSNPLLALITPTERESA